MRRWTRIGTLCNTASAGERVDVESLVLDTAAHARGDRDYLKRGRVVAHRSLYLRPSRCSRHQRWCASEAAASR